MLNFLFFSAIAFILITLAAAFPSSTTEGPTATAPTPTANVTLPPPALLNLLLTPLDMFLLVLTVLATFYIAFIIAAKAAGESTTTITKPFRRMKECLWGLLNMIQHAATQTRFSRAPSSIAYDDGDDADRTAAE